jgi:TolB-like protein/Tfp pilus assembly protein PilF
VLRNRTLFGVIAAAIAAILATAGYALYRERHAQVTVSAKALAAPAHSIAVLPFVNMSGDAGQEYFSDGLSEELIDMLSRVGELQVPARTSSFYFKGKQVTIADIAKALGVANVLEGSVRKSGNTLRVTAQLIRVDNGYHIWSETYDRKLDDVFKIQDEIAAAVVGSLKLKLLEAPTTRARPTENVAAHDQYLLGRKLDARVNYTVNRKAVEAFRKAVQLDPDYSSAWAGLAQATLDAAQAIRSVAERKPSWQEAKTAAEKAITLRPDLADGYAARAAARLYGFWDLRGASEDFRRALAIEPENTEILLGYSSQLLMYEGHLEEAITMAKKALTGDPLNASGWDSVGLIQFYHGDYLSARESWQRSLAIDPEQSWAASTVALTYILLGDPASALPVARRATDPEFRLQAMALAEHGLGDIKGAHQRLHQLITGYAESAAYQIAEIYARWGDQEHAFQWLDTSYLQHDNGVLLIKVDPLLASLRTDRRYQALLQK